MPLSIARKLLPPSAIIDVSCTTPKHVHKAVEEGADYVDLGAVYATSTKDVSAPGLQQRRAGLLVSGSRPNKRRRTHAKES